MLSTTSFYLHLALQEDAHAVELELDPATGTALFGVFDGHGGKITSTHGGAKRMNATVGVFSLFPPLTPTFVPGDYHKPRNSLGRAQAPAVLRPLPWRDGTMWALLAWQCKFCPHWLESLTLTSLSGCFAFGIVGCAAAFPLMTRPLSDRPPPEEATSVQPG